MISNTIRSWKKVMMRKRVRDSIHHQLIRAIQWRITCGRWE
nr:MAG TPA: hypothetical protein [Caudoviricetes sp.]